MRGTPTSYLSDNQALFLTPSLLLSPPLAASASLCLWSLTLPLQSCLREPGPVTQLALPAARHPPLHHVRQIRGRTGDQSASLPVAGRGRGSLSLWPLCQAVLACAEPRRERKTRRWIAMSSWWMFQWDFRTTMTKKENSTAWRRGEGGGRMGSAGSYIYYYYFF